MPAHTEGKLGSCLAGRFPSLVLRFICSVTYFLGSRCQGAVQFVKQCVEIFSCEPPLERFSDSLVVPFEGVAPTAARNGSRLASRFFVGRWRNRFRFGSAEWVHERAP